MLIVVFAITAAVLGFQAIGAQQQGEKLTAKAALLGGPLHSLAKLASHSSRFKDVEVLSDLAIDGATAYTGLATISTATRDRIEGLSTKIVAQNITTGVRTTIYGRTDSVVGGLVAKGGHVYALVYRVDSYRNSLVHVQLLDFSGNENKPRLLTSERARIKDVCYPARLTDVTAAGEAVVVRPVTRGACTDLGQIEIVGPDKSRRVVVARASLTGPAVSTGDWLLYRHGSRLRASNLKSGEVVDYWWRGFSNVSLSATGDLLPTASEVFGSYGDANAEPSLLTISRAAPDAPSVGARLPLRRVAIGAFCGAGYVELVATAASADFYELFEKHDFFTVYMRLLGSNGVFNAYVQGPVGLELRTADGQFVRSLGTIGEGEVLQPTCSGNTLTVPVVKSKTIRYRQFDAS